MPRSKRPPVTPPPRFRNASPSIASSTPSSPSTSVADFNEPDDDSGTPTPPRKRARVSQDSRSSTTDDSTTRARQALAARIRETPFEAIWRTVAETEDLEPGLPRISPAHVRHVPHAELAAYANTLQQALSILAFLVSWDEMTPRRLPLRAATAAAPDGLEGDLAGMLTAFNAALDVTKDERFLAHNVEASIHDFREMILRRMRWHDYFDEPGPHKASFEVKGSVPNRATFYAMFGLYGEDDFDSIDCWTYETELSPERLLQRWGKIIKKDPGNKKKMEIKGPDYRVSWNPRTLEVMLLLAYGPIR